MKAVLFSIAFFDLAHVRHLPPEYKLLLAACAVHPRISACGVIDLTEFVTAGLSIPRQVVIEMAKALDKSGIAVFDEGTLEFFILYTFHTWKTSRDLPSGHPWGAAVLAAQSRIRSRRVADAVATAISGAPAHKEEATLVPCNVLSALPGCQGGGRRTASELLSFLVLMVSPLQTASGIFIPDLDALGALASLPPQVILQCIQSFSLRGALFWDDATGELFIPARIRGAFPRQYKEILGSIDACCSRKILRAARREFDRRYPKFAKKKPNDLRDVCKKSDSYRLVDVDVDLEVENKKREVRQAVDESRRNYDKRILNEMKKKLKKVA